MSGARNTVVALVLAFATAAGPWTGAAAGAEQRAPAAPLVVDDDRVQCPAADYRSVQDAVDAAQAGDTVRVCAGLYVERVVVDKQLTIRGLPDVVDQVDCLDPSASSLAIDSATFAVLQPPDLASDVWQGDPLPGSAITLAADGIRLTGFVVQGAPNAPVAGTAPDGSAVSFYPGAIATSPEHSGYRVDHNLVRLNTLGLEATSDGRLQTRVDHNCVRENTWGLANQRFALRDAGLDHNTTTKTRFFAYEVGWAVAPMVSVTFESNQSVGDLSTPWRIEASTDIAVVSNVVRGASIAINVARQNVGVLLAGNRITGSATSLRGIAVPGAASPPPSAPTTGLRIIDNVVTDIGTAPTVGIGISIATNSGITGATITGNTASYNSQSGILVTATSSQVEGNIANGNGQFGIVGAPGSVGNAFVANQMLGNGSNDARELGANTWVANDCVTDNVGGAICGTPTT